MLFVSLMSSRQFALNAASFPDPVLWSNYPDAWVKGSFGTYFVNSLIYTVAIVAGSLIIATLAAFPIARGHLRGSNYYYLLFLSGILLPAGIIPQFFIMQQLGIYDTRLGYILLWWSRIALPIFIITGFIKSIPSELDDAAAMDGCPYLQYILQIVMPLLEAGLERRRADPGDPHLERHHRPGHLPALAAPSSRSRPGCSSSSPRTPPSSR